MPCPMVARLPRLTVWVAVAASHGRESGASPESDADGAEHRRQRSVAGGRRHRAVPQQNLQQTPIAITAVNAAMLEQRNQTDISQVAGQAPNVTLQPNGAAFGSSMVAFIRGVGQTDFNLALEPGVGIYVDDVYYATLTGSLLDLLDLDRVEILRGPQGTLAGKNSIGGAIKLFSQKPTGEGGGYLEAATAVAQSRRCARRRRLHADRRTSCSRACRSRASTTTATSPASTTRCTHPGSDVPHIQLGDGCVLGQGRQPGLRCCAHRVAVARLGCGRGERGRGRHERPVRCAGEHHYSSSTLQALGAATYIRLRRAPIVNGAPATYGAQFIPYGPYSQDPNHPERSVPELRDLLRPTRDRSSVLGDDPYAPVTVPPINHFKIWGFSSDIKWTLAGQADPDLDHRLSRLHQPVRRADGRLAGRSADPAAAADAQLNSARSCA